MSLRIVLNRIRAVPVGQVEQPLQHADTLHAAITDQVLCPQTCVPADQGCPAKQMGSPFLNA